MEEHAVSPLLEPPGVALALPRLAYIVGRLDRALRRHLNEDLRPYGLTWQQYTLLSVLRTRSDLSGAQLARRSFITPQSMSEAIRALVQKGYVRRDADPTHGRILRVELTQEGQRVLAACDHVEDAIEEQMLSELTARERERLRKHLRSCVRMLGAGLTELWLTPRVEASNRSGRSSSSRSRARKRAPSAP